MFDHIGINPDTQAAARRARAGLLTTLCLGAAGAALLTLGALTATDNTMQVFDADWTSPDMAEVADEGPTVAMLPPPPPPPAAAARSQDTTPEDVERPDDPEEMNEQVQDLPEEVRPEVQTRSVPDGIEDGVPDGVAAGTADGVVGGDPDGEVGGELGGVVDGTLNATGTGPRVFHHSELEARRRATPLYPAAARGMDLGEQRCTVRVRMDRSGTPYDATVTGCPSLFHAAARDGILKWRWYPPKLGKTKVSAETVVVVRFQQR